MDSLKRLESLRRKRDAAYDAYVKADREFQIEKYWDDVLDANPDPDEIPMNAALPLPIHKQNSLVQNKPLTGYTRIR